LTRRPRRDASEARGRGGTGSARRG
jgi:hypothetical protein